MGRGEAEKITSREEDRIFSLYNEWKSLKEISYLTGRSYNAIRERILNAYGSAYYNKACRQKKENTETDLNRLSKEVILSTYLISLLCFPRSYGEEKGRKYEVSCGNIKKDCIKNSNIRNGFIIPIK